MPKLFGEPDDRKRSQGRANPEEEDDKDAPCKKARVTSTGVDTSTRSAVLLAGSSTNVGTNAPLLSAKRAADEVSSTHTTEAGAPIATNDSTTSGTQRALKRNTPTAVAVSNAKRESRASWVDNGTKKKIGICLGGGVNGIARYFQIVRVNPRFPSWNRAKGQYPSLAVYHTCLPRPIPLAKPDAPAPLGAINQPSTSHPDAIDRGHIVSQVGSSASSEQPIAPLAVADHGEAYGVLPARQKATIFLTPALPRARAPPVAINRTPPATAHCPEIPHGDTTSRLCIALATSTIQLDKAEVLGHVWLHLKGRTPPTIKRRAHQQLCTNYGPVGISDVANIVHVPVSTGGTSSGINVIGLNPVDRDATGGGFAYAPAQQQASDAFGVGGGFPAYFNVAGHGEAHDVYPVDQRANITQEGPTLPGAQIAFGAGAVDHALFTGAGNDEGLGVRAVEYDTNSAQDAPMQPVAQGDFGAGGGFLAPAVVANQGEADGERHDGYGTINEQDVPMQQQAPDTFCVGDGILAPLDDAGNGAGNDEADGVNSVDVGTSIVQVPTLPQAQNNFGSEQLAVSSTLDGTSSGDTSSELSAGQNSRSAVIAHPTKQPLVITSAGGEQTAISSVLALSSKLVANGDYPASQDVIEGITVRTPAQLLATTGFGVGSTFPAPLPVTDNGDSDSKSDSLSDGESDGKRPDSQDAIEDTMEDIAGMLDRLMQNEAAAPSPAHIQEIEELASRLGRVMQEAEGPAIDPAAPVARPDDSDSDGEDFLQKLRTPPGILHWTEKRRRHHGPAILSPHSLRVKAVFQVLAKEAMKNAQNEDSVEELNSLVRMSDDDILQLYRRRNGPGQTGHTAPPEEPAPDNEHDPSSQGDGHAPDGADDDYDSDAATVLTTRVYSNDELEQEQDYQDEEVELVIQGRVPLRQLQQR
ncbi:hypothetical protein GGI17_002817 [Coemansia sp. S146]|nr:hypothetical protein GGI17_002817 [Coemansia sp. S146]